MGVTPTSKMGISEPEGPLHFQTQWLVHPGSCCAANHARVRSDGNPRMVVGGGVKMLCSGSALGLVWLGGGGEGGVHECYLFLLSTKQGIGWVLQPCTRSE